MSTSAIIRVCDKNKEVGAVVLWSDGYPGFARDRLLRAVAEEYEGEDADGVIAGLPVVLARLYNIDIFNDEDDDALMAAEKKISRCYEVFDSFKQAAAACGGGDYHYTVHCVEGKVYY